MKTQLPLPCLALVTDRRLAGDRLVECVREAVAGGVGLVELREKDLPAGELLALAQRLREATRGRALLVVNDRVDVALASGADGVHLPEASLAVASARRLVGGQRLVGRSVHSLAAAQESAAERADYLILGTIFATTSKPGLAPAGVSLVEEVAPRVPIPVLAIGGVTARNVEQVIEAGTSGAAVVSAIFSARSPRAAAEELADRMQRAWRASGKLNDRAHGAIGLLPRRERVG